MSNTKLKSAMMAAAALSVPLTIQWMENGRLREALSRAEDRSVAAAERAAQSKTSSSLGTIVDTAQPRDGTRTESVAPALPGSGPQSSAAANLALEWEHVLYMADPLQRTQELSKLIDALTAETAPEVAKAFERAIDGGIQFSDEQRLFLRAWGKLGGADAVEYALKHGGPAEGAVAALGGWASATRERAKGWLDALPESEEKEKLVYGLLDGWSTVDFRAAAAYAESRPNSPARDSFRELLLQRALRAGGIAAAQNWVAGIPDNEQTREYKQGAFGSVVQAMLYRDPAAAARWISELSGQSFVGADAVTSTARKLAESSPADALRWLFTLPQSKENVAQGAGSVLQDWAHQDAQAAGSWLQANASSPHYDRLAASYAAAVDPVDHEAAQQWIQTISDPQVRDQALVSAQPGYSPGQRMYLESIGDLQMEWTFAAAKLDGLRGSAVLKLPSGARLSHAYGDASGQQSREVAIEGTYPHGVGKQWENCTSCHTR